MNQGSPTSSPRRLQGPTSGIEHLDAYLAAFDQLEQRAAGSPRWLRDLRRDALARFVELGFPNTRMEEWRFTNVAPIARTEWALPAAASRKPQAESRIHGLHGLDGLAGAARLVFVNGRHAPEMSDRASLPPDIRLASLSESLKTSQGEAIEAHLARYAAYGDQAFTALNTAFIEDGAFLEIPRGTVLRKPIYLVFIGEPSGAPNMIHPRNLIVAGAASQASIVEVYAGRAGTYFTNAVTELVAEESAVIEHYKLQQESEEAFHVATLQIEQGRGSNFTAHSVALGGALVRSDTNSVLNGEGAECLLNGLYLARGSQHVDHHTVLDHARPHCSSREYYRGVLDGRASAVFNGAIVVRKDAQKTDAIQSNKNLLLSEEATINTKPQLQIQADDVRCTHGATIGQLDSGAVFYLQSRGIGREEARRLLVYAFANDVIGRMKVEALRARLEQELSTRLSHDNG
jgi:Fe-S cluster assembly protein SufD